ncbi:MAG: bifunctional ornithine acetyltransferase/N-acetylglutamate synthase [Alphaproteobacteria bacterium]|nr:bifunctional ornithine acetyltransferase/N-acetylglutamate synthase [Alphaproteobacteria bacterium]
MVGPVSPLAPAAFPSLPAVAGVTLAAAAAGIRYKDRVDVLLMGFAEGTTAAGVFTRSKAPSAPVDWCRAALAHGQARACVVNAGNANAFTGKKGVEAVQATAHATASLMHCAPHEVMLASTGVIGEPLPHGTLTAALPGLHAALDAVSWEMAARAIMTTDTFPKAATRTLHIGGEPVTINGIAKGSGMIAPDMATMLAFIATDAAIDAATLHAMLQRVTEVSFNCTTVDGDTSTSDTLMLFATGQSKATMDDAALQQFESALRDVATELAMLVVRDGEGASKFITIHVRGAEHDAAAKRIALTIANSPLVKTAIAGEDANWGRVVMAVGKSGEKADRDTLDIAMGGVLIASQGERVEGYDEAPVVAHMQGQEIAIDVDLHLGDGEAVVWTCDLTHGYIDINGSYRS